MLVCASHYQKLVISFSTCRKQFTSDNCEITHAKSNELVATRIVMDNVKQNVWLLVRKVILSCGINIWSCKSTTMDNSPNSALMIACG